ncbi:endonuclease/exonuclease/phosphatase family protein [Gluconobacter thailandicus]|uniref:Endonuclease/exonuclease/phosphatase family protein n=1 Tax=Gluconobacter thailandicus TaxID=257438 RepID=A0AAP9JIN0_GLUTH|nr:endonuclease/exonuclease/phosphatase family protein [Gluconobacter thailandicus]QEH97473.1 endonuclease/exonuclease/phosphatase family protein [Gluconobacter thailandicus]
MTASLLSGSPFRILSWNLLRWDGASLEDVLTVIRSEEPDVVLMQEAQEPVDVLPEILGGYYDRIPLPGRPHGTACWSRLPFTRPPSFYHLPRGLVVKRTAQIIDFGSFSLANVHLSHGQILNRRQLRSLTTNMHRRAVIMGDFNLVGPVMLPGFHDVGPKEKTHRMLDRLPLRLDRCLVRGVSRLEARALPRFGSDHRPISVTLRLSP